MIWLLFKEQFKLCISRWFFLSLLKSLIDYIAPAIVKTVVLTGSICFCIIRDKFEISQLIGFFHVWQYPYFVV